MFHGSSPLLSCQRRRSNGQTTMICSVLTWSRRWKENGKKGGKRNKAGERLKRNADIEKKKTKPWGIKICIVKQICQCKTKCHGIFSLKSWTDFEFESYNRKSSREMKEKKKKKTVTCCSSMAAEGAGQMKATYQQVISQLSSIST